MSFVEKDLKIHLIKIHTLRNKFFKCYKKNLQIKLLALRRKRRNRFEQYLRGQMDII